jgi:RNA-directed DNA polymerase
MRFWQWLKAFLLRRRIVRDVSRLTVDAVGDEAATREELVKSGDFPWKPGSLRRAIRDPRLMPKPKPVVPYQWRGKRPKVLSRDEADRLFSDSMRTRDRNVRDLATDVVQLERYGLPVWTSEAEVATALGLSVKHLRHYSIHRQRETTPHYVTFAIPKRSGGHRLIFAPKRRLKAIQRKLHELLTSKLPVSPYAHGFRKGRSVATNAAQHVAKAVVIKLDIADCFPTLHIGRVRGLLIAYGYSFPVAQCLAILMTEPPRQPVEIDGKLFHVPVGSRVCVQGAPTSPALCNAILRRLDYRLAGLGRKHGFAYSRYADDLTFSGQDAGKIKVLVALAARIARDEGLPLNQKKTRIERSAQRQAVTGVIVNKTLGLSRQERRRLRAALHQRRSASDVEPAIDRQLQGKLAYLRMLNPAQADALASRGYMHGS